MIGVLCSEYEVSIVEEFFQLFKTPWCLFEEGKYYQTVISTVDVCDRINAKLLLLISSRKLIFDGEEISPNQDERCDLNLVSKNSRCPLFGKYRTFENSDEIILKSEEGDILGYKVEREGLEIVRVGYDLFAEVSYLLKHGQPIEYAMIPTLDIHAAILRDIILDAGIPLVEIPAVPSGFQFMVCLTHDVDFIGIRNHKFDHTLLGFIYRATLRNLFNYMVGRISFGDLLTNFRAFFSLPFVFMGLIKDFMIQFEKYAQMEDGLASTYFFLPFKNKAGKQSNGSKAPASRGGPYDVHEMKHHIDFLKNNKCEIGLHGIDAWCDEQKCWQEIDRIHQVSGDIPAGVRMHWLYFSEDTHEVLENCNFSYDSTWGYNETIGYKAGTTQVFRPYGVKKILELPLNLMDTALFYSGRMSLTTDQAEVLSDKLIETTIKYGGVVTTNWHQRSVGPERLWGGFYGRLISNFKKRNAWFGTGNDVVSWFRKRRQISFDVQSNDTSQFTFYLKNEFKDELPKMLIRIHRPPNAKWRVKLDGAELSFDRPFIDVALKTEISVSLLSRSNNNKTSRIIQ